MAHNNLDFSFMMNQDVHYGSDTHNDENVNTMNKFAGNQRSNHTIKESNKLFPLRKRSNGKQIFQNFK